MPEEVAQSPQNGIRRTAEAVRLIYLYAVNILMINCVIRRFLDIKIIQVRFLSF